MCNCIQEIEKKVKEEYVFELPNIKHVHFANKAFMIKDGTIGDTVLFQPIDVDYTKIAKSGREQNKTATIRISPAYCPFCGEKLEQSSC